MKFLKLFVVYETQGVFPLKRLSCCIESEVKQFVKRSFPSIHKVLDDSSPSGRIRTPFCKKLSRDAIELGDNKRGDPSCINAVVEVGLNNPLLQSGHLEVIDAPGMSENEALDTIVDECMHGVLQVIVYVIDGNSSLRLQVSTLSLGFELNFSTR